MEIQKLSDEVVNQIAAGEVVERPAHLIKELVENSIDAGATEVEVSFSQGGRQVEVVDNGKGMSAEDLSLSVERHATSKIRQADDIWNVHSHGFRGEALASIAAVSRLSLRSRTEQGPGHEITVEFGNKSVPKEVGGAKGTRVSVEALFENMPARMKFLKSDAAETTQIKQVLRALAMAYPRVSFRVRHKSKLLFYFSATESLKERVENVLEAPNLHEGECELGHFKIRFVISSPHQVVHQARQIWLFVRGRYVQDRNLQHAILEAYRGLLMHGEYPYAAVFVECPPSEVDVNIHPTKSQVKFRDRSGAFRVVHRGLRQLLEKAPWLQGILPKKADQVEANESGSGVGASLQSQFDHQSFQKNQMARPTMSPVRSEIESLVSSHQEFPVQPVISDGEPKWSSLSLLAQSDLTYLVTQSDSALVFVDQHAAHERVIYESLMRDWKDGKTETQSLLIPMSIDLPEDQVEAMSSQLPLLTAFGIEIEIMGPSSLALTAIPTLLSEDALVSAIGKMADELVEKGGSFSLEKAIAEVFASAACHSAVRAGQALSIEQMQKLLVQMDEFSLSSFCPHGRPVFVEMKFSELERRFGRIT